MFLGVGVEQAKRMNAMADAGGAQSRPNWTLTGARWSFLVTTDRSQDMPTLRWWWRAAAESGTIWEGDEIFGSLVACQADAATHGFEH